MKAITLTTVLFATIGLAACSKPAPEAPEQATPSATAPAPAAAAAPVDKLVKNVVADAIPFQPEAAKVDGNALVSTGVPGYMMFGPYVAFAPGSYHVTVKGSIPNLQSGAAVDFDVVSGGAKTVHGEHLVTTTMPSGNIAEFDVTIPEGVTDLELRAHVTEGADVRIESYEIAKTN